MVFAEFCDTNCVPILVSDFDYKAKMGSHFVLLLAVVGTH